MNIQIKKLQESDLNNIEKEWEVRKPFEKRLEAQKKKESSFYIIWNNDNPIGHGRILWRKIPILEDIYIDESLRSKGFGSILIKFLENEVKIKNNFQIKLYVEEDNKKAIMFYEKLNYQKTNKTNSLNEIELIKQLK